MDVLCPARMLPETPLVFILPVEKQGEARYGCPEQLLAQTATADRLGACLAFPQFAQTPWYADHPAGTVRQEHEMTGAALEAAQSAAGRRFAPAQRLLAGFSKSGWGAFSLLLRNSTVFGMAAAWDAPFLNERLDRWDLADVFGSAENLRRHTLPYLLAQGCEPFLQAARLVLHGYNLFRADLEAAHALLQAHQVPHRFRDDCLAPHAWDMTWLYPLLTDLLDLYHQGRTR